VGGGASISEGEQLAAYAMNGRTMGLEKKIDWGGGGGGTTVPSNGETKSFLP